MTNSKRLLGLYNLSALIILVLLLTMTATSCGGKGGSTMAPSIDVDDPFHVTGNVNYEPGHNLFGFCTIYFDPLTGTSQLRFHRTVEVHLNLSAFLTHTNCPDGSCLHWKVTDYDAIEYIYFVDMTLTNPTVFTAYDMRIIFCGLPENPDTEESWEIANPDSYTDLWDPDPHDWDTTEEWLNPFIAFEKEDHDREFLPDPDGGGPAVYSDKEKLQMYVPPGSGGGVIEIMIDASWPDHCKDPYEIMDMEQSSVLPPNDPLSTVIFECVIADWQEDIIDVSVYIPDIVDDSVGSLVQMHQYSTDTWPPGDGLPPFDAEEIEFLIEYSDYTFSTLRKYYCNVTNDLLANKGWYDAIVIAQSIDTDGGNNDTIYNRFDFEVNAGGSGGDPTLNLMIVFSSYANGSDSDIYCYHFLTNEIIRLTGDGARYSEEIDPCINSTGDEIAFVSNIDPISGTKGNFDLYTLPLMFGPGGQPIPSGGDNSAAWHLENGNAGDERMPDYNFNGTNLAFTCDINGQYEIYTTPIGAPGAPFRVTYSYGRDEAPHYDRMDNTDHWLFFHSDRSGGGNFEIYAIDPQDKESSFNLPDRYTFDPDFDGYPATRGLGEPALAWTSDRYGDLDILFTNFIDPTVNLTTVEEHHPMDMYPSFSADGIWIAFMSDRKDNNQDIWRITYEKDNLTRVTYHELPDSDPCYGGGL